MSGESQDEQDKTHDPTAQKLKKAREKGETARSPDLSVAASYAGLLLAAMAMGAQSLSNVGGLLASFLDHPDRMGLSGTPGPGGGLVGGILYSAAISLLPWFVIPAAAVLLSILAQRGFVVVPDKVQFKFSRLSLLANAKKKFGRAGLFEFAKSFAKLVLYSVCLGTFLNARLAEILSATGSDPHSVVLLLVNLGVEFLFLVLLVSGAIGAVDAVWQHAEHRRKNRMSRKELMDETKDAEGDPHMKQKRRMRGQEIAMSQMMADVPDADVVIVNPTHVAIALKWSRAAGAAPVCVAKGVDEIAATIRKTAEAAGVPIHHDPPTARALHATVELGQEIAEEHYRAVAAAIRFAERMRARAKESIV